MRKLLSRVVKIFLLCVWVILFLALITNEKVFLELTDMVKSSPIVSFFLILIIQISLASLLLPCSPMSALIGVLFGLELGIIVATISTLSASALTFAIGRHLLKDKVSFLLEHKLIVKLVTLLNKIGWLAVILGHANPLFPGSSLGYAFSFTNISFKRFLIGALIGSAPLNFLLVYFGHYALRLNL